MTLEHLTDLYAWHKGDKSSKLAKLIELFLVCSTEERRALRRMSPARIRAYDNYEAAVDKERFFRLNGVQMADQTKTKKAVVVENKSGKLALPN